MADEQVAQLYATLEVIAETKSVEEMEAALESVDQQLGSVRKGIEETRKAQEEYEEWTKAVTVALDALGITAEEWATQLQKQEAEMNAAMDEAHKMNAEFDRLGGTFDKTGGATAALAEKFTSLIRAMTSGSIMDVVKTFMDMPAWAAAAAGAVMKVAGAVAELAREAEQLQNKALSTGISVEGIQAFRRLGEEAGVGATTVENAILRMQKAAEGNSKVFKKLGINLREFLGEDTETQFNMVAQKIAALGTESERTAALTSMFGRGMAQNLMPVIQQLVTDGMPQMVELSKAQVAQLAALDDSLDDAGGAWDDFKKQLLSLIAETPGIQEFFHFLGTTIRDIAKWIKTEMIPAMREFNASVKDFFGQMAAESQASAAKTVQMLQQIKTGMTDANALRAGGKGGGGFSASGLNEEQRTVLEQLRLGKSIDELIGKYTKLRDASGKAAEGYSNEADKLRGLNPELDETKKKHGEAGDATEKAAKAWDKYMKALDSALESSRQKMAAHHIERMKLLRGIEEVADRVGLVGPNLSRSDQEALDQADRARLAKSDVGSSGTAGLIGRNMGKMIEEGFSDASIMKRFAFLGEDAARTMLDNMRKQMGKQAPSVVESLGSALKNALRSLPSVILGAIQGGGDVGRAVGSFLGGSIGDNLGKKLGEKFKDAKGLFGGLLKSLGDLAGPVGSILGSVIGGGISKLASALGIGGNKVIMQVNDMRDAFFKAQGGFEAFSKQMAKVSNEDWAKKIFDAKTVEEFNSLVAEATRLMNLESDALAMGEDIMQRYGLTLEQMGPKFAQLGLDKMSAQLIQDWTYLVGIGADLNAVLEKMAPEVSKFLDTSIRAGAEIPAAMKPVIDALWEQGKLLHEDGTAYTEAEYKALKYGKTQTEMFDSLIKKITELVNALLGIPNDVSTNVNVHTNYTSSGDPGGGGGGGGRRGGPPEDDVPMAEGGLITRPTRILAGEAGAEAIVPLNQLGNMGGVSKSDMDAMIGKQTRELAKVFRDAVLQARG